MRVLLINNETLHLEEFRRLMPDAHLQVIKPPELSGIAIGAYDCAVLSGSYSKAVLYNLDYFAEELKLIREAPVPVIGICLGFQMIVHAFGGTVRKMSDKLQGWQTIEAVRPDPMFEGKRYLSVYEGHSWTVTDLPEGLVGYANSATGWEIVKHTDKKIIGLQFHPEVTDQGDDGKKLFLHVLKNG